MQDINAVSYTHLDVYKRQMQERETGSATGTTTRTEPAGIPTKGRGTRRSAERPRSRTARKPARTRIQPCSGEHICGKLRAVSYTHLDVYKRQTLCVSADTSAKYALVNFIRF